MGMVYESDLKLTRHKKVIPVSILKDKKSIQLNTYDWHDNEINTLGPTKIGNQRLNLLGPED